jgi:UDP-N-acetylmuramate--alanine ligase
MIKHIHLIGIGGAGMSAIADVLLNLEYKVSGSDLVESPTTLRLKELGAQIYIGHNPSNINNADVVVYSSAINPYNIELQEAKKRNILVVSRSDMLAELAQLKYSIAVAGSHGKTTTTAMIAKLLKEAGLDPTAIVGGKMREVASNAYLGDGKYLVFETDESDGSFLKFNPMLGVILNIDFEHLDYYKEFNQLKSAFLEFANKVPFLLGAIIYCIDDINLSELFKSLKRRKISYGFSHTAEVKATDFLLKSKESYFKVYYKDKFFGDFKLRILGKHNILNALACICVGLELGIPQRVIKDALLNFAGVERRLQLKADIKGIKIIDDYAHHPTEIRATLSALNLMEKNRLYVIFQPHRYTRTQLLYEEFGKCFTHADYLILTDIYGANEEPIEGVSSQLIVDSIKRNTDIPVEFLPMSEIVEYIVKRLEPKDIVLTLGAGNIWKIGEKIIECLKN